MFPFISVWLEQLLPLQLQAQAAPHYLAEVTAQQPTPPCKFLASMRLLAVQMYASMQICSNKGAEQQIGVVSYAQRDGPLIKKRSEYQS